MNSELKRKLLTRKFSSLEYMEELLLYFGRCVDALETCLNDWDQHCEGVVDTSSWNPADTAQAWEQRALPNYYMLLDGIKEGIDKFKEGDSEYIEGISNSVMNLSRNMDVLGRKWLWEIDRDIARNHGENLTISKQIGSNIWRTVGNYWKTPNSILKESITGPVDEQDLLNYLHPGEDPNA